jgi:hypothetical protein
MRLFFPLLFGVALLGGCSAHPPAPFDSHHPASPDAGEGPAYQTTPLSEEAQPATEPSDAPSEGGHHHGH